MADPVGRTLLGKGLERGIIGDSPDSRAASVLYASAAPQFALAKTYLGEVLLKAGQHERAFALFKAASDAGEASAMTRLAALTKRRRRNVAHNSTAARRLLRAAAERGNNVATWRLGLQYRDAVQG